MSTIKILIIGNNNWVDSKKTNLLCALPVSHTLEIINDINDAIKRLEHNSYDVLLIQDNFCGHNSIELCQMAYAMSKPSIVICDSVLSYVKHLLWKSFSNFTNRFKISRKLIYFNLGDEKIFDMIITLAENHFKYFNDVNAEIKKNTGF